MKTRYGLGLGALGVLWPAVALAQAPAAEAPKLELREAPKPTIATEDPLSARPGGLTSDVVAQKAVAASPAIASRQAEIDAANAKVDQGLIQYFPRLTLKATYTKTSPVSLAFPGAGGSIVGAQHPGGIFPGTCPIPNDPTGATTPCIVDSQNTPIGAAPFNFSIPVVTDNYMLSANLSVPFSDYILRLSNTLAGTRANERSTQFQKQAEILKAATDARIAYYNWVRGVAATTVAESALVRIKALQKDTEAQFSVGVATKADVLRVDSLSASTELTITDTQNLKQLAGEQLAILMAEPPRDYEVGENVRAMLPATDRAAPLPTLVAEAHRKRLELKALSEANRSLDKAAAVIRMGEYPRLDGFGEFDYARPNRNYLFDPKAWHYNWMLGLSLSYTINDSFSNKASAAEFDANRRKLQSDTENLRRGIQLEVTSAYLDQKKAYVALEASQRGLRSAQEAYRVALDLYRVGRATTTELIAAEQELLSAALREVNAAIDLRLAVIRLAHATGRDVPGG